MRRGVAVLLVAAAFAGGVALPGVARASDVVVTRPPLAAVPPGCSPLEVAEAFVKFFEAFNRGDMATLDALWVEEDTPGQPLGGTMQFAWYSMTEGGVRQPSRHRAIFDRPDLLPYFAERHRQNERMRLLFVSTGPANSSRQAVGFSVAFTRHADDLPERLGGKQRIGAGKGTFLCGRQQFNALSLGMHDAQPGAEFPAEWDLSTGGPCPRPSGWTVSTGPPVACTNGPNASALASGFRLTSSSARLPAPCAPIAVRRQVAAMLGSFNMGARSSDAFVRSFDERGVFRRVTTGRAIRGRAALRAFARQRYAEGEGWTAALLAAPRRANKETATYRLVLNVRYQGHDAPRATAQLSVSCRSGLVRSWVGPTR